MNINYEHGNDTVYNGIKYFFQGLRLCIHKGMKRYMLVPIIINIFIIIIGCYASISWACNYTGELIAGSLPEWLFWIKYLVFPIIFAAIILITLYLFTTITLIVGAPFYSLLSEKAESILINEPTPDVPISQTIRETPAMVGRELAKLIYRLPFIILNLFMLFIPIIGQVVIIYTGSWCYALDFTSYGFENNHISLKKTFAVANNHKRVLLAFGCCVWLAMLIPFLNLLMVPAAVCGGTILWVKVLRQDVMQEVTEYRNKVLAMKESNNDMNSESTDIQKTEYSKL